MQAEETSKLD